MATKRSVWPALAMFSMTAFVLAVATSYYKIQTLTVDLANARLESMPGEPLECPATPAPECAGPDPVVLSKSRKCISGRLFDRVDGGWLEIGRC